MSFEIFFILIVALVIYATFKLFFDTRSKKLKVSSKQFYKDIQETINKELDLFEEHITIKHRTKIPDTQDIPIEDDKRWDKIPGIICCFVDMAGSTALSAALSEDDGERLAKSYKLFTDTAISIFDVLGSSYIDVKGDGVFALFNSDQPHRALAATISFKTFVHQYFTPKIEEMTGLKVGGHFGIDQEEVLVRRFGLKRYKYRTDRQNEVWAGQPVNMAVKLAGLSSDNQLWMSPRFFKNLNLENFSLAVGWKPEVRAFDNSSKRFSFENAHVLSDNWSELDGALRCKQLLDLDKKD